MRAKEVFAFKYVNEAHSEMSPVGGDMSIYCHCVKESIKF